MIHPKHSNSMPDRTEAWQLQRHRNTRMAWILASIALAFFLGFLVKMTWLGS
ncbi:MAG: cytochrome oxidase small assembly protein [Comamonas sp.]